MVSVNMDMTTFQIKMKSDNSMLKKVIGKLRNTDKVWNPCQEVSYNTHINNYADLRQFSNDIKDLSQRDLAEIFDFVCERGLHQHAKLVLENKDSHGVKNGANPNIAQKSDDGFTMEKYPVLKAANQGYYDVLRVIKETPNEHGPFRFTAVYEARSILHYVLRRKKRAADKTGDCDYGKCLDVLLEGDTKTDMKNIINKQDSNDCTALHYATTHWPQATIRRLLDLGANIGIKNRWQEIPISKIRPEIMNEFLDSESCLSFKGDILHKDFSLTFHYDFLAPDKGLIPKNISTVDVEQPMLEQGQRLALPETESLWYMGQSKEHRHLLKHPVITSFLWFKWKRIRKSFNRNLRLYILFVFLLTWYIFARFGSNQHSGDTLRWCFFLFIPLVIFLIVLVWRDITSDIKEVYCPTGNIRRKPTQSCFVSYLIDLLFIIFMFIVLIGGFLSLDQEKNTTERMKLEEMGKAMENIETIKIDDILKYALFILLAILSIRELLQMMVSFKRYIANPENGIEVAMIIIVSLMLSNIFNVSVNRHLAAISICLSWGEFVTIVGRHPRRNRLNIYVTMFFKVLKDFLLFLLFYSMFIIAFGFGLYIILHKDPSMKSASNNSTNEMAVLRCGNGSQLAVPSPTNVKQVITCPDGTQLEVKAEEEYEFFNKKWLALVKTSTMFVGELEFSDIPVDLDSDLAPLTYLFFLSFVFFVVVVLMNLLTGLAVGEIGEIRNKAEIYSYLSQVETISYIESMMLGDPFDFLKNVPKVLYWVDSCSFCRLLFKFGAVQKLFLNFGAGFLLFYGFLPDKKVEIKPNQNNNSCQRSCLAVSSCSCLTEEEMGKAIIASAKQIIVKRSREEEEQKTKNREDKLKFQEILADFFPNRGR